MTRDSHKGGADLASGKTAGSDPHLDLTMPLEPGDAVAAIILVDGRYLLQLRDLKREIFFPGHWGCFGGGIEPGETDSQAIVRELEEELGLEIDEADLKYFTRFDFDLEFADCGRIYRKFYELSIAAELAQRIRLGEGQEVRGFAVDEILGSALRLTPYDSFALWLHIDRHRLQP